LLSTVVEKALAFLLGLLLCGVLYRGGNTPFAVQILGSGASLVLLLSLLHTQHRPQASSIASIALVVAFFALLIVGLTGLFPVSVESWLGLPARSYYQDVVLWHRRLQPDLKNLALSLDTVGTTQAVWIAVTALAVCIGAFALSRPLIMKLLAVFVLLAIVEAILGMLQYALSGPAFLSYSPMPQNRAIGTFINRNHFATWLAMSLPIVLLRISGAFTFQSSDRSSRPGYWQVWWGFAIVLITAALLASGSRAGSSAALIVTVTTLCVIATRKMPGKRSLIVLAIVSTLALLISETILPRFALAFSDDALRESSAGRTIMYARALDAAKQFFPVGSGLGSFSIAFQRFQPPELEGLFIVHVHNDYIQLLFETGAAGLLILALFAVAAVATAIDLFRNRDDFHRVAPAVGCFLGATAFAFHSLFDFPAHIPAVAIAATFLFTAAIRLSVREAGSECRKPTVKAPQSVTITQVEPVTESRRVRRTQRTVSRQPDPALAALFHSRDPEAKGETPLEQTTAKPVD
jgi:O-antigen ligase